MKKIAFIGAGNMGGALVLGVCKTVNPQDVVIFDLNSERTAFLAKETGCVVAETAFDACSESEYVVLGVKPQQLRDVQTQLIPAMAKAIIYVLNLNNKSTKTIISTNLGIKNIFTNYEERIGSRLAGHYDIYYFFGEDLRLYK